MRALPNLDLEAAFLGAGVELARPSDAEVLRLPYADEEVEVARLNCVFAVDGPGTHRIGGIPGKFRLTGTPTIEGLGPEVAVAAVIESATDADGWWNHWKRPGIGVRGNATPGREEFDPLPNPVAPIIAQLQSKTTEIFDVCTERALAGQGKEWRTPGDKSTRGGGVWDVVVFSHAARALAFLECKRVQGSDRISDSQRAFLEACLLRRDMALEDLAIVSWSEG